ncbi:class I SAM-dependent methyltransferase [Actinomadura sp. CNU-125]|uniref:class I SAM-dependent methyltransferase n=1 Tax=Actinomadura sp. CNU-125 TaxID=1904961 RepID=UPI002916C5D6|nr:class I SAM-dependent methyltransferase [Actinomadura sp. CNU-125]
MAGRQLKRTRGGGRVPGALLWEAVRSVLARTAPEAGPSEVVDVGGGTGGFAVPLAELGHRVTVVDASPDALAALERRAAEAGVRVRAVQGDAVDLPDLLGPGTPTSCCATACWSTSTTPRRRWRRSPRPSVPAGRSAC